MRPAVRLALDRLEHQQLGAVQVADDRHPGGDPCGRLVERRQVVQVQHVGVARRRRLQRARPGLDLLLGVGVVEQREAAVRRARPVLVGRVHRRVAPGIVHRPHVEARGRTRRASPGPTTEPETTVTSQPVRGSAAARLRATCAEPPRG